MSVLWAQAMKETGKSQFPYMKDPNTGKSMLESTDIIQYLFEQYGDGQVRSIQPGTLRHVSDCVQPHHAFCIQAIVCT